MTKKHNIHIKLEISRDKTSGNLNIITHFDDNAPNVFSDKDGYYWIPTEEEKDLINDSFELMPSYKSIPSLEKTEIKSTPQPDVTQPEIQKRFEPEKTPEPSTTQEPEPEKQITPPPEETPKHKYEFKEETFPSLEILKEDTAFEITQEKNSDEPVKQEETEEKKEDEDEEIIVRADEKAIEDALKKHVEEKDKSMVDVDEKTIIDKVLKQKKKWRK